MGRDFERRRKFAIRALDEARRIQVVSSKPHPKYPPPAS